MEEQSPHTGWLFEAYFRCQNAREKKNLGKAELWVGGRNATV